jgi:hypothetical protein
VSIIDTAAGSVAQTVSVGLGASGIGVGRGVAVVATLQAGSLSVVNLTNYSVSKVTLPAGTRPHESQQWHRGTRLSSQRQWPTHF